MADIFETKFPKEAEVIQQETQTSTNPTAPRVLEAIKRTHMRLTRNNTPGILPSIKNPQQERVRNPAQKENMHPSIEKNK